MLMSEKKAATKKSSLISILVNICLGTAQIILGLFSGSQGLVADGIHSLSDMFSDFVVLVANQHSHKDPDHDHPYGHQRYETAASLFIGVSLIAVGVGMLWNVITSLLEPDMTRQVKWIALWVALGSLVIKEGLFQYIIYVAKKVKSSMLAANSWHARSDAASSLVVALGIIGALYGYPLFDTIAALVVGLIIVKMGWGFALEAFHDLMDRSLSDDMEKKIISIILATPGVKGCHDLKTRKTGDMILVDAHIEVDAKLTLQEGHDIGVNARNAVMQAMPVLNVMTHIDPV